MEVSIVDATSRGKHQFTMVNCPEYEADISCHPDDDPPSGMLNKREDSASKV